MHVVSESPLRVASLLWHRSTGEPALTVVCKATYVLQPGTSPLAPQQDAPNEDDDYWDDDPNRSLSTASDLAPFKARPEVVLVGHAFAPPKQLVRSLFVRLIVGTVDKSLEVHADRVWTQTGEMREGARFSKMRLRYERAAAGPSNPVGTRFDVADARGAAAVPNLQPPGLFVASPLDRFDAVGLGPIAPTWPARWERLRHYQASWSLRGWAATPLPADFDPAFFNVAPPDQQLELLRADERLTLEGLHPDHPRLVTSLPGVQPQAILERPGRAAENLRLRADTLWIDTDRGVCTLVWRGVVPLKHAEEGGRVMVRVENAEGREGAAPSRAESGNDTGTLFGVAAAGAHQTLPFLAQSSVESGSRSGVSFRTVLEDSALPFGGAQPMPAPAPQEDAAQTMFLSSGSPALAAPVLPPLPVPPPPPPVAPRAVVPAIPTMAPAPAAPLFVAVPPPVFAPPPGGSPHAERSPWASAGSVPDRPSVGPRFHSDASAVSKPESAAARPPLLVPSAPSPEARIDESAAKRGWKAAGKPSDVSPPLVMGAAHSALAASNAAASADAVKAPAAEAPAPVKTPALRVVTTPKEVIELLWFDPAFVGKMRRRPGWKEIMAQAKPRPNDEDAPGDAPPEKRQEMRDRREVFTLLARGEPADMRGLEEAITGAVGEDGVFIPPLVLVAGELELPFDEVEELKATVAAVTPLVGGDTRLQGAVDTAQKLLQTPWASGATEIAAAQTAKVREAFAQGSRAALPRYVEQMTERMLLHQRAYQKRTVLGKVCIRGVLALVGAAEGVPVYLPEALVVELPAFVRFGVRMVVEGRMQVDQYEGQGVAMRGVAVGRVVNPGGLKQSR